MILHWTILFSLIFCLFHFTGRSENLCKCSKRKKTPSGQKAHHSLGQNAHARGRFTPQICQLVSCYKLAIIVALDT